MQKKLGQGISRRDFLKLGGAGLAGAALLGTAGCGGGGSSSGDLILSFGPDDTGTLPKLLEQFNKQSKSFKVKQRVMPSDTGAYFDKLRTEFQAGGGDIDIIVGDVIWPAQFAVNGWVSDLSDRFKDTDAFLPGPMQAATYQGKVYAVPWYTDAGLLYYRKDLLEKSGYSGPPETWDDLMEMAEKVQNDAGTKNGFVYQGADYEGGVCNGLEYIRTNGGDVLDPEDPTKVIIDSPGSVRGMATWRETIQTGVSPQAVLQYAEDESAASFLNDEAVFIRNWPYMYALAGTTDYPKLEPEQLGIAADPGRQAREPELQYPGRMELPHQRHLRKSGRGVGVHRVDDRSRATGDKRGARLQAANQGDALRRSRGPEKGARRQARQGRHHQELHAAPDLPLLLGCLSGTLRAVQLVPLGRHLPRGCRKSTLQTNLQEIIDQGEQAAG